MKPLSLNKSSFNPDQAHLVISTVSLGVKCTLRINVDYPQGLVLTQLVEKRLHALATPYGTLVGFELNRAEPRERKKKVLPTAITVRDIDFGWYRQLDAYVPIEVMQ